MMFMFNVQNLLPDLAMILKALITHLVIHCSSSFIVTMDDT